MGTTAQKLQRVLDTKEGLKDTINTYLGQDITSAIPFKDYETYIKNFYGELPKTSYAEGSNITLENCNKGKLDYEDNKVGYGDTKQEGEPTPTTPIPIQVVTGNQTVTVRGKNICNISFFTNKRQLDSDGLPVYTSNERIATVSPIDVSKYSNVVVSFEITKEAGRLLYSLFDENDTLLSRVTGKASGTSIDVSSASKLYICLYNANNDITTSDVTYIQVETGTTATTYEPYITPITKQLSLGDIELAKIGTYRDYPWKNLTNGKWYKHSKVGKETLTGGDSENWVVSQSGTANWYYALQKTIGGDTAKTNQLKSNYYPYSSITSTTTGEGIWYSASYIRVRYGTEDTPSNYKTWLSTHNVLLYYILAEATDTEITDTTLISQLEEIYNMPSVNGTTIVEINGNLPMIMKVRALKNG